MAVEIVSWPRNEEPDVRIEPATVEMHPTELPHPDSLYCV